MALQQSIESFLGHFRRQLEVAAQLSSGALVGVPHIELRVAMHRKILCCVMLDCLAGVRYQGQGLRNCERFVRLLRNHTRWSQGHLVSIPVLDQRLATTAPTDLRAHVRAQLDAADPNAGNSEPLSVFDSLQQDLLRLAKADKAARRQIKQAQHYRLVYRYRNFLVHEFREPGYAAELLGEGEREPRYHCHANDDTWRLLYPVGFFHRLVEEALTSLGAWFTADGVDPYDAVLDSSDW